jgi:predicted alpha/beta-hydrolase family hydrolase
VRIYLAHGASGSIETMRPWVAALRRRGIDARAVGLPRGTAERALPIYRGLIEAEARAAGDDLATSVVIGGHSFGGRVASLIAAEQPVRALVLLSYPLHRPGHPEQLRVEHWPRIGCPVLLLSGESDPFARLQSLREQVRALPDAELVTYAAIGHGLAPVLDSATDRIAGFMAGLAGGAPADDQRRGRLVE